MKRLGRIIEINKGWRRVYTKFKLIELSSVTQSTSPLSSASISVAQSSLIYQITLAFLDDVSPWWPCLFQVTFGVPLTGPIRHERTNGHPHEVLWVPVAATISLLVIGISHSGQQSDPSLPAVWQFEEPKTQTQEIVSTLVNLIKLWLCLTVEVFFLWKSELAHQAPDCRDRKQN